MGSYSSSFPTAVVSLFRRVAFCEYTSGARSSIAPITHFAVGTSGVDSDGDPVMPSETQTDVINRVGLYPVTVSYPLTPRTTARYTGEIPDADLAGARINEAALIDSEGNAHQFINFYSKGKDAGVSMAFEFDDIF